MPMKNNLKTLMRVEKKNIWQLAEDFGVDYMLLVDTIAGKDHLDAKHEKMVVNRMIELDLCPECGAHTIPAGGCRHCLCGWEMCE